jgi:hypothetical protein
VRWLLKFLGRARKFFQDLGSEPVSRVQYFNVLCASGHRVRGERTEGYQALRCPSCGDGVFVLPRSPLPEPVAPERPMKRKPASMDERWVDEGPVELSEPATTAVDVAGSELLAADAEIIWDDPPSETAGRGAAVPAPLRAKSNVVETEAPRPVVGDGGQSTTARAPVSDPSTRPRARTKPRGSIPPSSPAGPPRHDDSIAADRNRKDRRRKPDVAKPPNGRGQLLDQPAAAVIEPVRTPRKSRRYSLIFSAVAVLVMATIGFRYRQQTRQQYPLIAERGRTEGIPALDEGKFDRAYQLLSAAKSAVDSLGGDIEGADEIREAAEEAAIFIDLSSETLEQMLEEAGHNPDVWPTRFDNLYKKRWIIIDAWIASVPEPGKGAYDLEYRVFPWSGASRFAGSESGRPERIGFIDLTDFQLLERSRPGLGERVTFGARLASFQLGSTGDLWVIRLDPTSGVFIRHGKALEILGWPSANSPDQNAEGPP